MNKIDSNQNDVLEEFADKYLETEEELEKTKEELVSEQRKTKNLFKRLREAQTVSVNKVEEPQNETDELKVFFNILERFSQTKPMSKQLKTDLEQYFEYKQEKVGKATFGRILCDTNSSFGEEILKKQRSNRYSDPEDEVKVEMVEDHSKLISASQVEPN